MSINEFFYWLREQDKSAKVLIVESPRDVRLWNVLASDEIANDSIVIPISTVELPNCDGGERGRALALAEFTRGSEIECRVLFFIDSDNDQILGVSHQLPVVTTDYRDIESYAFTPGHWQLLATGLDIDSGDANSVLDTILNVGKRLGFLHATNASGDFNLPIVRTLERKIHKYLYKKDNVLFFDEERFFNALFAEGRGENGIREKFCELYEQLSSNFTSNPLTAVRGKDAGHILSRQIGKDVESCKSAINTCLVFSKSSLSTFSSIAYAKAFLQ